MRCIMFLLILFRSLPAATDSFGMDDHFDRDLSWGVGGYGDDDVRQAIAMMATAGVKWYRGGTTWQAVEPVKGAIDKTALQRLDLIHAEFQAHGMRQYYTLGSQPHWASSAPDSADYWAYPPAHLADWATYVSFMAQRFKGKITYWEIWNEPDWVFWKGSMQQYVEYLTVAYLALKQADPNNQVLIGGFAGNGVNGLDPKTPGSKDRALQQLYEAGGKPYFDIMSIHGFVGAPNQMEDKIAACYSEMAKYGDASKRLWITELGYSTFGNAPSALMDQAVRVRSVYSALMMHPRVDKVFWYNFRCRSYDDNYTNNLGMVNIDFSPRPAYDTLKAITGGQTVRLAPFRAGSAPERKVGFEWGERDPGSRQAWQRSALGRVFPANAQSGILAWKSSDPVGGMSARSR